MNSALSKGAFALAAALLATQAYAQVTLYEDEGFAGRSVTTSKPVADLERYGFNNRAASAVVKGARWEVCDEERFGGRCVVLRPGRYATLSAMSLNNRVSSARNLRADARVRDSRYAPLPVVAQATFYEQEGFAGRSFITAQPVVNLRRFGFNDRASSAVIVGERWETCDEPRFGGRCTVLRPGNYPSLASTGLDSRIASARNLNPAARVDDARYAPVLAAAPAAVPAPNQDYRRRRDERLYEGTVTSTKVVVGPPEQRCWTERVETTPATPGKASVPGAVVGALIGGILGHQVGGGKGQDIATAGGAVAGGVVGANVGRSAAAPPVTQDVKRCENVQSQTPSYYDVTYNFRGVEHRVQMTTPPGPTIPVNERGEPRA